MSDAQGISPSTEAAAGSPSATSDRGGGFFDANGRLSAWEELSIALQPARWSHMPQHIRQRWLRRAANPAASMNDSRKPTVAIDADVDKSGQAAADCASWPLPECVMLEEQVFQM